MCVKNTFRQGKYSDFLSFGNSLARFSALRRWRPADPAAAALRVGPGGSCRLRGGCWLDGLRRLRFPSLAGLVLPGFPVPSGKIQGVEAVEGGGSGGAAGSMALADPVGCAGWPRLPPSLPAGSGLRHYYGPGQPPAACRLDGRGKDGRTGLIVEAVEVLAVRPGIPVLRLDPGR